MRALLFTLCLIPALASAQSAKLSKDQPIEIVADKLEVIEPKQQAIFSGNVLAEQGDIDLKSQRMVVHYSNKNQSTSDAQGIKRIEATGNVFFIAPTETARGDAAVYDVSSNTIMLSGNVVLTRGENVIRGSSLTYDIAKGRSVVSNSSATGASGGRVRSLFVPGSSN